MKAVLIVLVLLLAPAQAWASCAWVLWTESLGSGPRDWSLNTAHPTLEKCQAALKEELVLLKQDGMKHEGAKVTTMKRAGREYVTVTIYEPDMKRSVDYTFRPVCLPDTIDPRGPKGK